MDHRQVAWTAASLENGAVGLSVRHNAYMQASFTSQNKDVIDIQYSKHTPTFQQLQKCS